MNPSDVFAHCYYGRGLMFSGNPSDALGHFARFKRLNPDDPGAHMAYMYFAIALMFLERWQEAEAMARESLAYCGGRNGWSLVVLMIALQAQGHETEARAVVGDLARVVPHWNADFVHTFFHDCQQDKSLLTAMDEYLDRAWR